MEAMVNNLIKALGWSIFHSLWQSAAVYGLLFLIFLALPKLNAKLKHNLSFGALVLMLGTFCFTFYSIFELPLNAAEKKILSNIFINSQFSDHNLTNSFGFIKAESWFPVICTLYLAGIAIQLMVLVFGYQRLKVFKRSGVSVVPAQWNKVFLVTLSRLKIRREVKFFLSEKVNVPLVIGYFKPVVLFPLALATQLDVKHVEAILIHELSHIRRNDYLLNLIKTTIETLLFFNPFIWLTGRFIRIEREHACDDLVVKHTGAPLNYAHALLRLELLKDKYSPALSMAATGSNQYLYQRIKRITNMKTTYINAKQQLMIFALTLTTLLSLAWINPPKATAKKAKNLATVKIAPGEYKSLQITAKADTDTTKKKKNHKITITDDKGNTRTYTSIQELPDSLRRVILKSQRFGDSISAYYNSKEWKDKMAAIQENALALQKKFESKEWKEQTEKMQEHAKEMQKKFESKEWKEQMAKMQQNAAEMQKKFESKEWKEQIEKMQKNSLELQKKFESKEWKDQMAKIQENALAMVKKFNSKEWKEQMEKIQKNSLELEKKFNSSEWKAKIEEMRKLQKTPEYQELKKKFDKDVEDLKKQKGLKQDE